jgi:hypothetical protein
MLIHFLAALLIATTALAQNDASESCFSLTGTTMCKSYDGFLVQTAKSDFGDVASFDAYIKKQLPQSRSYVKEFQDFYQCPDWRGDFQRYTLSTLCAYLVLKSGCVQSKPAPSLCQESCDSFISAGVAILANQTACPTATVFLS